jgi:phenylacetate-CoA ligase
MEQHQPVDRDERMSRIEDRPALPRLGSWRGVGALSGLQEERLPVAMELASRSPFYRDRVPRAGGPRTIGELAKLARTTKKDLRAAYPYGMLAVPRQRLATYHESSGTTGEPTSSYFTERDWFDVIDRFRRNAVRFGASDTVLVKTPYAMMTTGPQAHDGARLAGATIIAAGNRSLIMPYSRIVRMLHDLSVTVTWSLPSQCLLWAAAARAAGYAPDRDFPQLRAFLVGGEPLTEARRARISAIWGGVKVFQDYGSTETGSLAGECCNGTLHLWADRFVPEVVDPTTGESSPRGTGHLVITTLYREAMPLVRYDLEDLVEVSDADCSCGWALPALRHHGRSGAGVRVGGTRLTQSALERHVFGLPLEYGVWMWRARRVGGGLAVEIEAPAEHAGAACAELTTAISQHTGVPCVVSALPPGQLVPLATLTQPVAFSKPRSLFDEDENWDPPTYYS